MVHFTNQVKEHMTRNPVCLSRNTTVIDAWNMMQELQVRHFPVLDNGIVVGLVSDRNLRQAKPFAASMHLTLEDVMITDPYCVSDHTLLSEVLSVMGERKIGSSVLLDSSGQVVGIFTATDAIKILSQILERMAHEKNFEPNMEQFMSGSLSF